MLCVLIGLPLLFFLWLAMSAGLFMFSCTLCGVRAPEFGQCYFIMFCTWFVSMLVWGLVFTMSMVVAPEDEVQAMVVYQAFSLFATPINMLLWAALVQLMVPTTFYRAIVIWGMQIVMGVAAGILLVMSFSNPLAQQATGL